MDLHSIVERLYTQLFGDNTNINSHQTALNVVSSQNTFNSIQQKSNKHQQQTSRPFRWTEELHRRFCIICTSLHWKVCTPKHIHRLLPSVPVPVIASHLQKTRIGILNEVDAPTYDSIPVKYRDDQIFRAIIEFWQENNRCLSDDEIRLILGD
ncbi:Conserved_hypothetical protein [Hexamita inflata]|uniref:Uncharacterized protein n=1 Tax=Hexamita inflata TaxID=28002 RepID=A0AA86QU89_9EUKA|nr:Conserved hypothetical protein [Hexamita inflata]